MKLIIGGLISKIQGPSGCRDLNLIAKELDAAMYEQSIEILGHSPYLIADVTGVQEPSSIAFAAFSGDLMSSCRQFVPQGTGSCQELGTMFLSEEPCTRRPLPHVQNHVQQLTQPSHFFFRGVFASDLMLWVYCPQKLTARMLTITLHCYGNPKSFKSFSCADCYLERLVP